MIKTNKSKAIWLHQYNYVNLFCHHLLMSFQANHNFCGENAITTQQQLLSNKKQHKSIIKVVLMSQSMKSYKSFM